MSNFFSLFCQASSTRPLAFLQMLRVFLILGCLSGITVILAGCSSNEVSDTPSPIPTLSAVSSQEVKNYATAILSIEQNRQTAYNDIQKLNNDEKVPDINCTKPDTMKDLRKSIQDIAVNYCNKSKKIIEGHSLTMGQFNAITVSAQGNPELKKRIQNELLRLQK